MTSIEGDPKHPDLPFHYDIGIGYERGIPN
jgi:hypothetical protein